MPALTLLVSLVSLLVSLLMSLLVLLVSLLVLLVSFLVARIATGCIHDILLGLLCCVDGEGREKRLADVDRCEKQAAELVQQATAVPLGLVSTRHRLTPYCFHALLQYLRHLQLPWTPAAQYRGLCDDHQQRCFCFCCQHYML